MARTGSRLEGDRPCGRAAAWPVVLALLTLAGATAGGAPVADLLRVLAERGCVVDTARVEQAAFDAALHAIDPGARRLPRTLAVETGAVPASLTVATNWPGDIFYARVATLQTQDLVTVCADLGRGLATNSTGLILDLRGAGGTDFDALDAVASVFVPDGEDLYELRVGASNVVSRRQAARAAPLPALPPVILVTDQTTRGTSEVLAAVFAGRRGFMLLGTPTAGDSARRERLPLSDAEDLLVATAWVVPASGRPFKGLGVLPDLVVAAAPAMPAAGAAATTVRPHEVEAPPSSRPPGAHELQAALLRQVIGGDLPLQRAADILRGLAALHIPVTAAEAP